MDYTFVELKEILRRNDEYMLFHEKSLIKEHALDPFFAQRLNDLSNIAEEAKAKRPWIPTLSDYRVFQDTGMAEEYFEWYAERRKFLNALVFMAIVTEDVSYLPYVEDYIWAIIQTYKWTTPRDPEFYEERGRDGVPHEECLDLLSTETGFTFAEIDALLGDRLSQFIRRHIKQESLKRIVYSFSNKTYYHWWETCNINWAAVCGCSVAGTAMYYLEDSDELAEILLRILQTMKCFLDGYQDDGVCVEGISYWKYGFSYFVFFCELLRERTNGEIDLMQDEKVHQIALFLQRCRLGENEILNFGDSEQRLSYQIGFIHMLKTYFSDVEVPPSRYVENYHQERRHRWAGFIRDFAWFKKEFVQDDKDVLIDNHYFEKSQIYIAHKNGTCFAVLGGHNGYIHGHNDLGHFVYYVGGKGIFIDIGQGAYTREYFGAQRYTIINTGSAGHSVPLVNDEVQQEGTEYCVTEMHTVHGACDVVGMDITKAYECPGLERLYRIFEYQADGTLCICDRICTKGTSSITESFVVSVTEEPILEDGKVILKKDDITVCLLYDKRFRSLSIEKISSENITACDDQGMRIIRMNTQMESGCGEYRFTIFKC